MDRLIRTRGPSGHVSLMGLLVLALMFSISTLAGGQTTTGQTMQPTDNDTTRAQVAEMDRFLDSHPEVSEQLRKDPSLIRNKEFVSNHPALQQFFQEHPGIREEFTENPNAFMQREGRFERHEDWDARDRDGDRDRDFDRDRDHDRDRDGRDRDVTRGELSTMDKFLDSHREIAEQLHKDPSLIKNKEFVDNHPALEEFLETHPEIREEFRENPNGFMRQEARFDRREDLASMDRFLDSHPEVSEQLHKDPSLIKNKEFIEQHPALQEYLQTHPDVREQFRNDPDAFMRREERFDRHEDDRDRVAGFHDSDRDGMSVHDADRGATGLRDTDRTATSVQGADRHDRDTTSFGQFLGGHSGIAQQLSKDPSLANNKEFLASHAELQDYLKAHPEVSQELAKNPQSVITSAAPPANGTTTNPKMEPKHKQ